MPNSQRVRCFADNSLESVDEVTRTARFVAATMGVIKRWSGNELVSIKGISLKQFSRNGVVLDSHNRFTAAAVIGKGRAFVDGDNLMVDITFAETDAGNTVWELVRTDFIRAVSIGITVQEIKTVEAGKSIKMNGQVIEGPVEIYTKSVLDEISVVPIPANPDALRVAYADLLMSGPDDRAEYSNEEEPVTEETKENQTMSEAEKVALEAAQMAADVEEANARKFAAYAQQIRMLADPADVGARAIVEAAIAEGVEFAAARERVKTYLVDRMKPVGTPSAPAAVFSAGHETAAPVETPETPEKKYSDDTIVKMFK